MPLNIKRRLQALADWLRRNYLSLLKKLAIALCVLIILVIADTSARYLADLLPDLALPAGLIGPDELNRRTLANEIFRSHWSVAVGIGGLVALIFLGVRSMAMYKQAAIAEQGQITERFTRAIDQLGAADKNGEPKLEIRLGAIYALERIARDSERDHWTVMEVLTAYVRENTRSKDTEPVAGEEPQAEEPRPAKNPPRIDIQAILTVLGRRERSQAREGDLNLDLTETDLCRANLVEAHLENASLRGAHLEGAYLFEAHLEKAKLFGAHLENAYLSEAHLEGAYLGRADLRNAYDLTQKQINSARGNKDTKQPASLQMPKNWP